MTFLGFVGWSCWFRNPAVENQLRFVGYPIIYKVLAPSKRWLALGFLVAINSLFFEVVNHCSSLPWKVLETGYNSFVGSVSLPSGPQTPSTFTYLQPAGKNSIAKAEISWENLGNGDGIFRITWGTIFFPKQLALEVLTELKRGPWCGMTWRLLSASVMSRTFGHFCLPFWFSILYSIHHGLGGVHAFPLWGLG